MQYIDSPEQPTNHQLEMVTGTRGPSSNKPARPALRPALNKPKQPSEIQRKPVQDFQSPLNTNQVAEWGQINTKAVNDDIEDFNAQPSLQEEAKTDAKPPNRTQGLNAGHLGEDKHTLQARERILQKLNSNNFQPKVVKGTLAERIEAKRLQLKQSQQEPKENSRLLDEKKPTVQKHKQTDYGQRQALDSSKIPTGPSLSKPQDNQEPEKGTKQHNPAYHESSSDEDQEDPWERINAATLAKVQDQKKRETAMDDKFVRSFFRNVVAEPFQTPQESKEQEDFFSSILCCFGSGKETMKSDAKLVGQLNQLVETQLTNTTEQIYLLRSIYTELAGDGYLRYGSHWSVLGFQGRDPATDLRSAGILALFNWFELNKLKPKLGQSLFKHCTEMGVPCALSLIKLTHQMWLIISNGKHTVRSWQQVNILYASLAWSLNKAIQSNIKLAGGLTDQFEAILKQCAIKFKDALKAAKKDPDFN